MNATHHIPSNVLASYAAGSLPEAFSLVVACHVSLCDSCRVDLESLETVGGALIEDIETADLSEGSFEATMALIAQGSKEAPVRKPSRRGSVFPAPLQEYVGGDLAQVKWRSVGGGVKQAILSSTKEGSARLLFIPGGTAVPDHSHSGLELTLVLQGAFSDSISRFARGDVETGDEHLTHTPVAEEGEPCICLAATDGPLRFKGFLPRLVQPFVRI